MDKERGGLPVLDFADAEAWETWLATHGGKAAGVWLKIAKAGNAASSLTKAQAIDGALCHGWIDGQIDKYDDAWFLTRFTLRKRTSKWSENNRKRAEQLVADDAWRRRDWPRSRRPRPMEDGTRPMPQPLPRRSRRI